MASIRARLTTAYTVALMGTMVAFAGALWVARRGEVYQELEQQAATQADLAVRIIERARTDQQSGSDEPPDSVARPPITRELRYALEGIPDYILVLDAQGRAVYPSFAVRQLDDDDLAKLQAFALQIPPDGSAHVVDLSADKLVVVARADTALGGGISRVVGGVSARSAQLAPRELVGTMLAITPLILGVSVIGAYFIGGRAFRPVDRLINELEAITDGRSLHRRLPVTSAGDEMSRLAVTLNEMLARLEHSFGALRRFTADASHELKTPLAVLRADVERAMSPGVSRDDRLVALEEGLHETARMADLVDSLLTLARADEGRFDLHREAIPLEPLVREVYETAVILGEDAGLTVSLPVLEDGVVLGDRPRLRQLFLNLITNGIKYTPRGGRLEISLSHRGPGEIAFAVRDTGIGISAADLPHIFERFWRADRVRSRASERGGFGLGLAISQWIAHAHGGSLTAQSRLGRGSTFTVMLPLAPAGASAPDADPVPTDEAAPA